VALARAVERGDDGGIRDVVPIDDWSQPGGLGRQRRDVGGDRPGAVLEIGALLFQEVIVEAVEDQERDEQQRQRDDRDERQRQARLEAARRK
jgi:hypothetical protein